MRTTAVWLDRTQAKIAHYPRELGDGHFQALHTDHHSHRLDSLDIKREEKMMFEFLAERLKESAEILILGPGVAKYHFKNFLNEQHPREAKKVVLFQAMDYPTENQLQAFVENFIQGKRPSASGE